MIDLGNLSHLVIFGRGDSAMIPNQSATVAKCTRRVLSSIYFQWHLKLSNRGKPHCAKRVAQKRAGSFPWATSFARCCPPHDNCGITALCLKVLLKMNATKKCLVHFATTAVDVESQAESWHFCNPKSPVNGALKNLHLKNRLLLSAIFQLAFRLDSHVCTSSALCRFVLQNVFHRKPC